MHPAFSVIAFTTLSGSGYGLLFWLGMHYAFRPLPLSPEFALILFGLSCTATSLYTMTGFDTYVPPHTIVWTGMLQGFGLGFIFVPLSTVAYATLSPKLRAEGASVFSLSRNMGSSVGISVVMAVLSRNMATNHAYLTENITAENLGGINMHMLPEGLIGGAGGVLQMVNGEITRQAATIAYLNDFKLMMWVVLAATPLVFLLRKHAPPPQQAAA